MAFKMLVAEEQTVWAQEDPFESVRRLLENPTELFFMWAGAVNSILEIKTAKCSSFIY